MAGFIGAIASPDWFIAEQIPIEQPMGFSANSRLITLQLGNLYWLLAMIGVAVLSSTAEIRVVRNYLVALWLADIGHIAVTWRALGHEYFMDVAKWNAMTWGNIGATVRFPIKLAWAALTPNLGIPLFDKDGVLCRGIRP